MTDYIKREDLLDLYDLGGLEVENAKVPLNVVIQTIKDMPSADVVERKKGKWKQGYCSECRYNWSKDAPIANVPNFCPNCGTNMRDKVV